MTDHAQLFDAIVRPAFGPMVGHGDNATVDDHLAECAACRATLASVRADEAAIGAFAAGDPSAWVRNRVLDTATDRRSSWRGASRLLVVGLLAVAAIAGGVAGAGALMGLRTVAEDPLPPPTLADLVAGKPIIWKNDAVLLAADAIELSANGKALHPGAQPTKVGGDPGSRERATLEVNWVEGGLDQRIHLSFGADAASWWMSEARAYDNVGPSPKDATLGPLLTRQPVGQPFSGALDLGGVNGASVVRLRVTGAILVFAPQPSFVEPPGGGMPLKSDPFAFGGPLHCSGILQMRPVDAERDLVSRGIRLSWRFVTKTGPNTGFSDLRLQAPAIGWISGTALGSDGELIIFVEDPAKPMADPIAAPLDCPAPPSP